MTSLVLNKFQIGSQCKFFNKKTYRTIAIFNVEFFRGAICATSSTEHFHGIRAGGKRRIRSHT